MAFPPVLDLRCPGLGCAPSLHALLGPQDNWRTYPTLSWTMAGTARTITVGPDGSVYVAVEGTESTKINVYTSTGTFVRELASFSAATKVGGMDVGTRAASAMVATAAAIACK